MEKSRREFLLGATSALAVTSASGLFVGCSSIDRIIFEPEQQSLVEVVIVGAGLAGLTAALELKKRNIPYTIFEASPRLGGRVLSRRELSASGELVTVDLGMSTFNEADIPLVNLLKELKVPVSKSSNKSEMKIDPSFFELIEALQKRVAGIPEGRFLKASSPVSSIAFDGEFFSLGYVRGVLVQSRRSAKVIVAVPPSQIASVIKNLNNDFSAGIINFSKSIGMEEEQVAGFDWKSLPFVNGGRSTKSVVQMVPDSDFFYFKQDKKSLAIVGDYTNQKYFGKGAGAIQSAQDAVSWIIS